MLLQSAHEVLVLLGCLVEALRCDHERMPPPRESGIVRDYGRRDVDALASCKSGVRLLLDRHVALRGQFRLYFRDLRVGNLVVAGLGRTARTAKDLPYRQHSQSTAI
jgi:hypothetical protein